jgi:tetraacyldisaccharide 4'-kinase
MRSFLYNLATDKSRGFIPAAIKIFLLLLSFLYGGIALSLAFFFRLRPVRLPCRVISVGNITLGGTGKTAIVEFISRYLRDKGHKIAILSRGYKKTSEGSGDYKAVGDEPYMLSRNLGNIAVIVNRDRIKGAQEAFREQGADTVILDDGFQQWKIKKDLEIVAVDAVNPFGNRHLLPRGILREPLSSLRRSDIFLLTKVDLNPQYHKLRDFLARLNPGALIVDSIHRPVGFYPLGNNQELSGPDALKGETAALVSGIGDPDSFEALVKSLGINVGLSLRFPDHHNYSAQDVKDIILQSRKKNIAKIITTEKDAVRLLPEDAANQQMRFFVLRIALKITVNEEGFCARLLKLYSL